MKLGTILLLSVCTIQAYAQTNNVYFIGHSLVNFEMPQMIKSLADTSEVKHNYKAQIGVGANLKWNWVNPQTAQGDLYTEELTTGNFNTMVLTEAIPLDNHLKWSQTYSYVDSFQKLAVTYNSKIKTYIYETWHCINSGKPDGCPFDENDHLNWRSRIDADLDKWEGIVDSVNAKNSGSKVALIPAGQAMGNLYDAIESKSIPGISSIESLYVDDIHLNDTGNYFIACVMYAAIFRKSPVGLPNFTYDIYGTPFNNPSKELAERLQETAWNTVCEYFQLNKCALDIPKLPARNVNVKEEELKLYPNRVRETVMVKNIPNKYMGGALKIFSLTGEQVFYRLIDGTDLMIYTSSLQQGLYFVSVSKGDKRFSLRFSKI